MSLPHAVSAIEIFCDLGRSFAVSENGQQLVGFRILESQQSRLVKQNFGDGKCLAFAFQHERLGISVVLAERLGLAVSGGYDGKVVVYDWETGKVVKLFDLGPAPVSCLRGFGEVVFVGGRRTLRSIDLAALTQTRFRDELVSDYLDILSLESVASGGVSGLGQRDQRVQLFFGGTSSGTVTRLKLPVRMLRAGTRQEPVNLDSFEQSGIGERNRTPLSRWICALLRQLPRVSKCCSLELYRQLAFCICRSI